jgi:hypothetical protein
MVKKPLLAAVIPRNYRLTHPLLKCCKGIITL